MPLASTLIKKGGDELVVAIVVMKLRASVVLVLQSVDLNCITEPVGRPHVRGGAAYVRW